MGSLGPGADLARTLEYLMSVVLDYRNKLSQALRILFQDEVSMRSSRHGAGEKAQDEEPVVLSLFMIGNDPV